MDAHRPMDRLCDGPEMRGPHVAELFGNMGSFKSMELNYLEHVSNNEAMS